MTSPTRADVEGALAALIRNFEGREYLGTLGPATLLFADVGLTSIDAVVLGEKIQDRFGRALPFPRFIAELREQGAEDVPFGQLAAFVFESLNAA